MKKARVFIGSSTEGLKIAEAIQVNLDHKHHCTIWSQGVFGLSGGNLETLVQAGAEFDFAILVVTPDDLVTERGTTHSQARDNVVFELGLFIGLLGRDRTFFVHERAGSLKGRRVTLALPSDLAGITPATFEDRGGDDLRAALGAACYELDQAIQRVQKAATGKSQSRRMLASVFLVTKEFKKDVEHCIRGIVAKQGLYMPVVVADSNNFADPDASTTMMFARKATESEDQEVRPKIVGMLVITPADYKRFMPLGEDELRAALENFMFALANARDAAPPARRRIQERIVGVVVGCYGVSQVGKGGYPVQVTSAPDDGGPFTVSVRDLSFTFAPDDIDQILTQMPTQWTMAVARRVLAAEPSLSEYMPI